MTELRKITIDVRDLHNLKNVGKGTYGTVFADLENEIAIKQYNEYIKGEFGGHSRNPCLIVRRRKFKRLNARNEKLKYTDTSVELVYDGFRFIGVKKKYYKGSAFDKVDGKSLSTKKELLRKLIRNSKELYQNRIYNLDCRVENVLVTDDDEVKILDLDDIFTKVTLLPNLIYRLICLKKLQEVIIDFMYDNQMYFSSSFNQRLVNKPTENKRLSSCPSYSKLQRLVDSIKFEGNIVIVKAEEIENIDIKILRNYLEENGLSLVLAVDRKIRYYYDFLEEKFSYLEKNNIPIYDIFRCGDNYDEAVNNYISSHDCYNTHVYEDGFKVFRKK